MKPIIVNNSRIPGWVSRLPGAPIQVYAKVIWPWIICRSRLQDNPVKLRHELVHWYQQRELWVFPFYLLYKADYLRGLWKYRGQPHAKRLAYLNIRFEQEARAHQRTEEDYASRHRFGWRGFPL